MLKKLFNSFNLHKDNVRLQYIIICAIVLSITFFIIQNGAEPKKYKLELNERSPYNITAPRDIVNLVKAEEAAKKAEAAVAPILKREDTTGFEAFRSIDKFFNLVFSTRESVINTLNKAGIGEDSDDYAQVLSKEQQKAANSLAEELEGLDIPLSDDQIMYLIAKASDDDIQNFRNITMDLVGSAMKEEITVDNLPIKIVQLQDEFQKINISQSMRNIGVILSKSVLKPSREIDNELTEARKKQVYREAYEEALKTEKISKGERIISVGEVVTQDIMQMLQELNLIEDDSRFDTKYAVGILVFLAVLGLIYFKYIKINCKNFKFSRDKVILTSIIFLITMLAARILSSYLPPSAIPVLFAVMLISILVDYNVAFITNIALTLSISIITKGNMQFLFTSVISGTFAALFVSKAIQRSKISLAGFICGMMNVSVVAALGFIYRDNMDSILKDSAFAFANGIVCVIITLGTLPFWESVFNVVTPMKLLELINPNQPLMKRLLMEAPGTYHHSIMVGNLAEIAIESIGGNPLLARAGAYYHDIGKLKRPDFFKENQTSKNPHDKITPNLSKLIITSHTADGVEIAEKYKIPVPVKDIIEQHHGTTMVAYFYHKAKANGNGNADEIRPEDFRYPGPKPSTREAAVVMLADSVEAAVRSMPDKSEGKMEGMIRKIIKDKLDDGQFDLCNLTLKDLNDIANAFMNILGGYYHKREQYPETKISEGNVLVK